MTGRSVLPRPVAATVLRALGVVLWLAGLLLAVAVVAPIAITPAALICAGDWLLSREEDS